MVTSSSPSRRRGGSTNRTLHPNSRPPPDHDQDIDGSESNRASIHSLHSIHDSNPQREAPHHQLADSESEEGDDNDDNDNDDDDSQETAADSGSSIRRPKAIDDDNDAASIASTRSDQSEEAAGLVSRLSGESDREQRRAKYEGRGGNFKGAPRPNKLIDEEGFGAEADAQDGDDEGLASGLAGDDDFEGRQSLIGRNGFVDRRGTAGRVRRKGVPSRVWAIAREALPTLVLSLFSLVFSGELLVHLARWPAFIKVDKLFILIPILLNMKGNLEMNLSLRMSTSANIGELDIRRTRETLIKGNMALLQVQALIVSSFAGILAFALGVITPQTEVKAPVDKAPTPTTPESAMVESVVRSAFSALRLRSQTRRSIGGAAAPGTALEPRRIIHHHPKPPSDPALRLRNGYFEFVLVIATGMLSASLSSAILGSFMCALVVVSRRLGANPDNIASPLAASLGDLTTLTLLGLFASSLMHFEGTFLATVILAGLAVACIACLIVTYRNAYVRELLTSGWVPLLVAMFVSSGAGLVLDTYVGRYQGFALLAPVMAGLPGACAAIFASRITTALHSGKGASMLRKASKAADVGGVAGILASIRAVLSIPPIEGWLVPLTLLSIGVTIKVAFILLVRASGQMTFGVPFAVAFCCGSVAATTFALLLSHCVCLFLWSRDYDPDIYCLPYVSSTVDVVGQTLLVVAFKLATSMGDEITAVVNAGAGHGGA
ncbi:uncharacterized protein PFL1_00572 [Pseudozyma flocculosa PF-1]|uniref:SLC41A/MgtE integral membrane domain-containing protein n=1 Tax=Pseudozyma flocculosa TaxID=84751 RepID=A0A5C3ERD8_9BASI|nr:uncharacterized protein PFL1_00572 [Pseudozyma flocculosa PF-1]EPQ32376.1 hypothetical protein PFL1_00572 [Pseudozyma flocculosa PF-1]SPO34652.1 uncharacterized protein PSFLO_00123 [Pseudozyma flocculosa]